MDKMIHCLPFYVLLTAHTLIVAPSPQWKHTVYINPLNGNDKESCLSSENVHYACASLDYSISKLKDSTQIILSSDIHLVNNKVRISHSQYISMSGVDSRETTIECPVGSTSGLEFVDVFHLQISRITFKNCGCLFNSTTKGISEEMVLFRSAVYILNSSNVIIESTAFMNNRGVGLVLFDVSGSISLMKSNFSGNVVPESERDTYNGGGGLYIEHTYCTPGLLPQCDFENNHYSNDTTISISDCHFSGNQGSNVPNQSTTLLVFQQKTNSRRLGNGGGITVTLKGVSHQNTVAVTGCTFENNSAGFGGGLDIQLQDYVTDNILQIRNCQFVNNFATNGGGGMFIGIFYYEGDTVQGNKIVLSEVKFVDNRAQYGGGCEFASSRIKNNNTHPNFIMFTECEWNSNRAMLGAGLLLVPEAWNALTDGQLPVPLIDNCYFYGNQITTKDITTAVTDAAEGALYSATYTVNVSSSIQFTHNNGTALSATAGSINILHDTNVTFRENNGIQGGALALLEFATLHIFQGSRLVFDSNYASEVGGAIYAAVHDTIDFYYSRNCFIRYHDLTVNTKQWNATITFLNNSAGSNAKLATDRDKSHHQHVGARVSSIYAISILPCVRAADTSGSFRPHPGHAFPEGVYHFEDECYHDEFNRLCGIATAPSSLQINPVSDLLYYDSEILKVSPGEPFYLQLTAKDELNHTVFPVVTASIHPQNTHASLESASQYLVNSTVQIYGEINARFFLRLSTLARKKVTKLIEVQLAQCPPGFVYQKHLSKCECSVTVPSKQYLGIVRCSTIKFVSYQSKGYWAGCDQNGDLLTAKCPLDYCRPDENTTFNTNQLPKTCEGLDGVICGVRNRTGLLCGECIPNHTVFFHSERYNCQNCKLGNIGWLFYILSEPLPVTLVFIAVVVFNIHLTSGLWNGIILYAQIIDFIDARSSLSLEFPKGTSKLLSGYRFIYAMFNLEFFKFEDVFSFCLWDGATVMDILVFKYVTSVYSFILLLVLIFSFKSCFCQGKCQRSWESGQAVIRLSHHNDWVVHGITAFLVLSYAQCVKVSFQILSAVQLHGEGQIPVKTVVVLSGNVEYMSSEHLPYALPSIFVLTITTLPLILLVMYPNGLQIITACFGERAVDRSQQCCSLPVCRCFHKTTQITRFKPLYDSFQGCFKDKFRFFAGLFFLYRFTASLISAISLNTTYLFTSMEIMAIVMLALHAWTQPYELKFYNILDTFMYANLAVVNGLNLFNIHWVKNPTNFNHPIVSVNMAIQVILIHLPLVYVVVMWILLGLTACSKKVRQRFRQINEHIPLFKPSPEELRNFTDTENVPFDESMLPYRIFDDSYHEL